ncbi:MAG: hypothetical protein WCX28_03470 [Bacteriovoracaceae bacterium]|nr:hypothetical protein [Bacteroidota bacterium]
MIGTIAIPTHRPPDIHNVPFNILSLTGSDSVDFLQRISTNDFANFSAGESQKTLFVSDKGRMIDAVWVIHRNDQLLVLTGQGMGQTVQTFLEKYIIMDDVLVHDVSTQYKADLFFDQHSGYRIEYFGIDAIIDIQENVVLKTPIAVTIDPGYERWRIENGIPKAQKEIVQDFNPLELNLWNWISFTKGCYIGQEIIARLDTYHKIQRTLCSISSEHEFSEGDIVADEAGMDIGRITSALRCEHGYIGLCVVRIKHAVPHGRLHSKQKNNFITIERVFHKGNNERN